MAKGTSASFARSMDRIHNHMAASVFAASRGTRKQPSASATAEPAVRVFHGGKVRTFSDNGNVRVIQNIGVDRARAQFDALFPALKESAVEGVLLSGPVRHDDWKQK